MFKKICNIFLCFQIYCKYFGRAIVQIYLHYTSLYPLYIFLKALSLANRNIKVNVYPKSTGRPPLDKKIINLILELKKLNPTWGAQRISDELRKIGYKVSKPTVLKYLEISGLDTPPFLKGLKWDEYLANHKFKIGIDFSSLIDIWGNQLFIFVIINLDSRKLLSINATYSHHREWIVRQFRNAFYELEDYPTLCICDNDSVFGNWFVPLMNSYFQMKVLKIPWKMPRYNGKVERFHLSLKREAFYNVIPLGLGHVQKRCNQYQVYYNSHRPHQGIDGKIPSIGKSINVDQKFYKKAHFDGSITTFEPENMIAA